MSEGPSKIQLISFAVFLVCLFILALVFLPRVQTTSVAADQPTAEALILFETPVPTSTPPPPTPTTCKEAATSFVEQMDSLVAQWETELSIAGQVELDNLSAQVDKLRDVQQQVLAVTPPDCVASTYERLTQAMALTIEGYRGFVDELPEDAIRATLAEGKGIFDQYQTEIDSLR